MKNSVDVNDYMVRNPVTVTPDTDLVEAMNLMIKNRISGVTVIDEDNHPVGMLSELDCLRAILSLRYYQEEVGTMLVKDHMASPVETVPAHADVIQVAQSMLDHKHRRRPVVNDQNQLIGQLTCRAILGGMTETEKRRRSRGG